MNETSAEFRRPGAPRAALLRRGGFTLLELMVVMTVIAVIAAMAAPRYGRALARYRLDSAARRLVADLSLAREHARATSRSVTVSFSWMTSSYTISGLADPDGGGGEYTVRLGEEPYLVYIDNIDFACETFVTFDGFGKPGAGGEVTLMNGSYARSVLVDEKSGVASAP